MTLRCAPALLCCILAATAHAGEETCPYEDCPELYARVKEALLAGSGSAAEAVTAADEALREVVLLAGKERRGRSAKLEQLLALRGAAGLAAEGGDADTLAFLLEDRKYLGRFLHALDDGDRPLEALKVLKRLREVDEKRFAEHREFCIAFAVVWDDFRGYHWVDKACGALSDDHMIELYKYYFQHERQMVIKPWGLPFELSVFVVHSRVTPEERLWVLRNVTNLGDAYGIYRNVPWTQKLSPAHGKGEGIPYTLENIQRLGGVCMEQAYFTEQVYRLHGVPAIYMHGQGRSQEGHAWTGLFTAKRRARWDFSCGRYRNNRYYLGSAFDPTNVRGKGNWQASELIEAEIKMTAAVFTGGRRASLEDIEASYALADAALWAREHLPETVEGDEPVKRAEVVQGLLVDALKANQFNGRVWQIVVRMAEDRSLDSEQAVTWARRLADQTLKKFPDYTVALVGTFLECSERPELAIKIYNRLYSYLKRARPDLACNVMVAQGDAHLAAGNVRQALVCYVYPMINFSEDAHILGKAKKKLEAVGTAEADQDGVSAACKQILKALSKGKDTPERTEAARIIRRKLDSLSE